MPRLRRTDCSGPGITRRRAGRGFVYLDAGERVESAEVLARIRELGIPPAWRDVWICPDPNGHLQATGIDAAGRKQYRYHDEWRRKRDLEKFEDMVEFAHALPALRRRVEADLAASDAPDRSGVLATAVRLLDRGFFRIGTEEYSVRNESYGLATMRKAHVVIEGDVMVFDYPAKHGKRRVQAVVDPAVTDLVCQLKRRRGGGDELLAYKEGHRWQDVRSPDINAYLKEATGATSRPRTSAPGAPPFSRRSGWPCPARWPRRRPAASGRSPARSRRSPTTWATRRPCAARPTSTRGCSTPTTPAWSSARCSSRRSTRGRASCRSTTAPSRRRCWT
jgi:DNA topoisomerase IB